MTGDPGQQLTLTPKEQEAMEAWAAEVEDALLLEMTGPGENRDGRGIDLTLYINGKTVCGNVCSATEWAEALDTLAKQSTGAEHSVFGGWAQDLREGFAKHDAAWERKDEANPTDQDIKERWTTFHFIYLLNAYEITATGAKAPKNGWPLRVRRSAVNAWAIGTLALDKHP